MPAPDFTTLQDIREDAGLQHLDMAVELSGDVNGSNKDFFAPNRFIVDRDYDDTLDESDVVVYVNDVAVSVASVDGVSGKIVLASAPASEATVTADYAFSVAQDAKVSQRRAEAQDFIRNKVKSLIDYDDLTAQGGANPFPMVFATVTRLYAAGLLLVTDYGSDADTDESSKDGYKKIAKAKKLLDEYIEGISDDSDTNLTVSAASSVRTDGNLYRRSTDLSDSHCPTADDEFFQRG